MSGCFSFSATQDTCYRKSFNKSGLRSTTTDLGNGTVMHCWAPKAHTLSKPTLLMIHGFGANAMWQFNNFLPSLTPHFNLYVPDLLFFGDSLTTRPARTEAFQADCVVSLMDSLLERRVGGFHVFGISYGGFVAYRIAERYPGRVGRVVLACTGVCLEERDMEEGMFRVKSLEEAVGILLPQTPEKLRELMRLSFYKPPPRAPSCFLNDFVQVMCTEYRQEKKELILALYKDRKLSDLPRINQPTLIVWGEYDQVFPVELGHRLIRHLGDNAELIILKNAGHALNAEKTKELIKLIKSFLINSSSQLKEGIHTNGYKAD